MEDQLIQKRAIIDQVSTLENLNADNQKMKEMIHSIEKQLFAKNKKLEITQLEINEKKLASQFSEIVKEIGAENNLIQ